MPGPPVEAVIALSILFLAVELFYHYKGVDGLTVRNPWVVAFTFGLLHGFGFAGAGRHWPTSIGHFIAEEKGNKFGIYHNISELSMLMKKFRELELPSGEISRISQYISKITVDVENLNTILRYRTPITLRAYSKVFIYTFPILYGPYFASVAEHYSPNLEYLLPIIFSFILVSLDNIQGHLENPFDQVGEDDIIFDVEEFTSILNEVKSNQNNS